MGTENMDQTTDESKHELYKRHSNACIYHSELLNRSIF